MKAKRIVSLAVVVIFLLSLFSFTALAEIKVVVGAKGPSSVAPGQTFNVEFEGKAGTVGLAAYTITYDTSLFTLNESSCVFGSYVFYGRTAGNLEIQRQSGDTNFTSSPGTMFTLSFTACSTVALESMLSSGQISVADTITIDPTWYEEDKVHMIANASGQFYDISEVQCDYLAISVVLPHTAPTIEGVTISGSAVIGQTLTANLTNPQDNHGLTVLANYQWKVDGVNAGTNSSTYAVLPDDFGKTITVTATPYVAEDVDNDTGEPKTSAATAAVTGASGVFATVSFTGELAQPLVGVPLAANATGVPSSNGGAVNLAYSWTFDDGSALNGSPVNEATYTPIIDDFNGQTGKKIKVTVTPTGVRDAGAGTAASKTAANAILAGNMAPEVSAVTLTPASAVVGNTLTLAYVYSDLNSAGQNVTDTDVSEITWYRGTEIIKEVIATDPGAKTYTLTAADRDQNIEVTVKPVSSDDEENDNIPGSVTEGTPVDSNIVPVTKNTTYAPEAQNVKLNTSSIWINQDVTLTYTFFDGNGFDDETEVKVLIADDANGPFSTYTGTVTKESSGKFTFRVTTAELNKYIKIEVTPKNSDNTTGAVVTLPASEAYQVKRKATTTGGGGPVLYSTPTPTDTADPTASPTTSPDDGTGKYTPSYKFVDIPEEVYPWAIQAIDELVNDGVIYGKSETIFAPQDEVKRYEFAAMLARSMGFEASDNVTLPYTDVDSTHTCYEEIRACFELGIFDYMGEGTLFNPEEALPRDEMALMAYNAAVAAGITLPQLRAAIAFSDEASIMDAAKVAVDALSKAEIITGNGDGTFLPKGTTIRAAAAKVVYLVWGLLGAEIAE